MRVLALKSLASIALALASSSLAAEEVTVTAPEVAVERPIEEKHEATIPTDVEHEDAAVEKPPVAAEEVVREPEQFRMPVLQAKQEQQGQQAEPKPEQPEGEKLLLAALRFDTLFGYMSELQKRFFLAVLPDSWAVPKFLPSTNADLEQVQTFLREITQNMGAPNVPAALIELAESPQALETLQDYPRLPPVFQHLLSASTSSFKGIQKDINDTLAAILPDLDSADLDMVGRLFRVPSELEFPVSPEGLSLFLPVVVRNVSSLNVPSQPESGLKEVKASIQDVLVPVVDHQGELLFADAASVFQGIQLPQELSVQPLALFSALEVRDVLSRRGIVRSQSLNPSRAYCPLFRMYIYLQVEDVNSLWSAVKAPVLSKLSLLGSDAPALFGPVMTLASLPRVALSINGDSQQPAGTNQLAKIVGDVSSQLRRALRTFNDLTFPEAIAPSTQALMREPLEEFLNLKFLNFAIPVVGERETLAGYPSRAFAPFVELALSLSYAVSSSVSVSYFFVNPSVCAPLRIYFRSLWFFSLSGEFFGCFVASLSPCLSVSLSVSLSSPQEWLATLNRASSRPSTPSCCAAPRTVPWGCLFPPSPSSWCLPRRLSPNYRRELKVSLRSCGWPSSSSRGRSTLPSLRELLLQRTATVGLLLRVPP